jgi:GTP cyclohydrolase I
MALNKNKTDSKLGLEIHNYLKLIGLETPILSPDTSNFEILNLDEKISKISKSMSDIMDVLGLDRTDDSLSDTPKRVAKMYAQELFWGLDINNFPKITTVENKMGYDELVVEKGIQVSSFCEHHFITIDGKATVGYIPDKKVLGLSKMNRVVEYFSRRPQIQERLTEQIYYALQHILETDNIAVVIDATHYCVKSRGVEHQGCSTITSKMGGGFKLNDSLRSEFMRMIKSI